jgi:hypothetical protein
MSTTTGRNSRGTGVPTRQQLDELDALLKKMLELPVQPVEEATLPPPPAIPIRPSQRPAPFTEPIRSLPPGYTVVETASPESSAAREMPLPADPVQEQAAARLREEAEWQQYQSSWQPSAQTWGPLAETWRQTQPIAVPAVPEGAIPAYASEMATFPGESSPSVRTQTVEIPESPHAEAVPKPVATETATATATRTASPAPASPTPASPTSGRSLSPLWWPLLVLNWCFDAPTYLLGPLGRWLRGADGGGWLLFLGLLGFVAAAVVVVLDGIGWNW